MKFIIFLCALTCLCSLAQERHISDRFYQALPSWEESVDVRNLILALVLTPVPKTGQTISYAVGDDGDLEKGVAWSSPRFSDNGDGTVTDNNTGLMWLKEANAIMNLHSEFDNDSTVGDGAVYTQHAFDFLNGINNGTYAAGVNPAGTYTDWRLPNVKEMHSLINFGFYRPALSNASGIDQWTEADAFSGVESRAYWSSTTLADFTDNAWIVNLYNGYVSHGNKTSDTHYVWPVRGGN